MGEAERERFAIEDPLDNVIHDEAIKCDCGRRQEFSSRGLLRRIVIFIADLSILTGSNGPADL